MTAAKSSRKTTVTKLLEKAKKAAGTVPAEAASGAVEGAAAGAKKAAGIKEQQPGVAGNGKGRTTKDTKAKAAETAKKAVTKTAKKTVAKPSDGKKTVAKKTR